MPHISYPSKMPGGSWGLPADKCQTGSALRRLARDKGVKTACSVCYCFSGRIKMVRSQELLRSNLDEYQRDPNWVSLMTYEIERKSPEFFRFFHSGDLQSIEMLERIAEIAHRLPDTRFWVPTQERALVAGYLKSGEELPDNVTIRVSASIIDTPQSFFKKGIPGLTSSFIYTYEEHPDVAVPCPSHYFNGTCGPCRACWDREVVEVA